MSIVFKTHFYLLLVVTSLLSGCSNSDEGNPSSHIIPQDKFTEILAECQLAESQTTVTRVLQPIYKDSILNYYAGIFKTYEINSEDFYQSLKHYSKDPVLMDSIYSDVLAILKKKSDELGPIELPTNNLNAIARHQLGDILIQTPIAELVIGDSMNVFAIRDSLMSYMDENMYLLDSVNVNRESFEFSFVINTSTKIMLNQLRDYLTSLKNLDSK
jgi:hypothetical protein